MSETHIKISPDYALFIAGDHHALWLKYKKLFRKWTYPVSYTMEDEDLEHECYLFFRKRYAEIDVTKILRPDTWELKAAMYLAFKSLNKHLHSVYSRSSAHERISYDELSRADEEPSQGVLHHAVSEVHSPEVLLFQEEGFFFHESMDLLRRSHLKDEVTVLDLKRRGLTVTEIASTLGVSIRDVKITLTSVKNRLSQYLNIDLEREKRVRALHSKKFNEQAKRQRALKRTTVKISSGWRSEERHAENQRWTQLGSRVHT